VTASNYGKLTLRDYKGLRISSKKLDDVVKSIYNSFINPFEGFYKSSVENGKSSIIGY
jgi:hypothetical protein